MSSFLKKYRLLIAGILVVVLGGWLLLGGIDALTPRSDYAEFRTSYFSFTYPRIYHAEDYARGVATLGKKEGEVFTPYVEISRYRSDPDTATPATFDLFMKQQAGALCGADDSIESITCTEVGVTPYTSPKGVVGQKLALTLVRKNLKTGTTTSSTYAPLYVFNITSTATSTSANPKRYSAIFIYPSLSAFLSGTTNPELMDQVLNTFELKK